MIGKFWYSSLAWRWLSRSQVCRQVTQSQCLQSADLQNSLSSPNRGPGFGWHLVGGGISFINIINPSSPPPVSLLSPRQWDTSWSSPSCWQWPSSKGPSAQVTASQASHPSASRESKILIRLDIFLLSFKWPGHTPQSRFNRSIDIPSFSWTFDVLHSSVVGLLQKSADFVNCLHFNLVA